MFLSFYSVIFVYINYKKKKKPKFLITGSKYIKINLEKAVIFQI